MTERQAWSGARNVLCVRLDSLGDVLMTTPALRALKKGAPNRRITLLTAPAGAEVARLVPEVDDIIVYEAPWMKATAGRADSRPEYQMAELLRGRSFDAAVIFTVYSQNPLPAAFLCYLADIPLRLAHCHENPYQLLTDWLRDPEPEQQIRHEVQRQLDLVAAVGCLPADPRLSLAVPNRARSHIRERLAGLGLSDGRPWVLLHPGASASSRRYPPESYAAAVRRLTLKYGLRVLLSGTEPERDLVQDIRAASQVPTHAWVGNLALDEMAALIEQAPILLSNNTGPVHIAAAVGTPVVDLYALTNPQHTPWAVPNRVLNHDVPCKFCYKSVCPEGHHNCLRLVEPGQVVAAVIDLLHETGPWHWDGEAWQRRQDMAAEPQNAGTYVRAGI